MTSGENTTVVLLSGGLDSTTVLYQLIAQGQQPLALGVDYGQPHAEELLFARETCNALTVPSTVLVAPRIEGNGKANVYPGRNSILLSLALSHALTSGATAVAIGCNADDRRDYLDCRPSYLGAWGNLMLSHGVTLSAPLANLAKTEVVQLAHDLGVPIDRTRSCYRAGEPCGECAACVLREKALA